jgi:hypothetical protein
MNHKTKSRNPQEGSEEQAKEKKGNLCFTFFIFFFLPFQNSYKIFLNLKKIFGSLSCRIIFLIQGFHEEEISGLFLISILKSKRN